jgi:Calcineurin-like phosphoesterase
MRMRASPQAALASAVTLAALVFAACDTGDGTTPASAYTVVVLPDTQYYASSWPDIFMAQTRWIAENRTTQQIAFVLHTGDLVDQDLAEQWTVAAQAMHALDGLVPYVITAGNHDYGGMVADRMGMGSMYFPPAQFAPSPWFQGTFEADHIENSFSVVDVPGG